jgi:hypothetical protein
MRALYYQGQREYDVSTQIYARFLDPDDVQIAKVELTPNTVDVFRGHKVRLALKLPSGEDLKKTAKVQLQFEQLKARYYDTVLPYPLPSKK